jgi:hypothetical protein
VSRVPLITEAEESVMGVVRGWLNDMSVRNLHGRQEKRLAVGLAILSLGTGQGHCEVVTEAL